jgi:ACT domain-containing protein
MEKIMAQKNTPPNILSGKKLKALEALIACDTIDEACKVVGITRSTMYRYLKDPLFDKELKAAKRQLINRAILRLQQTCGDATRALAEICRDKKAPPSSRVSAAKEILSSALKSIELEEIEERIKNLEQRYLNG